MTFNKVVVLTESSQYDVWIDTVAGRTASVKHGFLPLDPDVTLGTLQKEDPPRCPRCSCHQHPQEEVAQQLQIKLAQGRLTMIPLHSSVRWHNLMFLKMMLRSNPTLGGPTNRPLFSRPRANHHPGWKCPVKQRPGPDVECPQTMVGMVDLRNGGYLEISL